MVSISFATTAHSDLLSQSAELDRCQKGGRLTAVMCMVTLLSLAGCLPPGANSVEGIETVLNTGNFEQEVLQCEVPVLVDVGATWCGPCQGMDPIVAALSVDFEGRVKVGKLDADESPGTLDEYGIYGLPTFLIFKDGKEVGRLLGPQSYRTLAELLESYLPDEGGSAS